MKKWVVFVEMIDRDDNQSAEWQAEHGLTEARIRELFDEHFGPELDETTSYKILGIEQKGAPKARSANG